MEDINRRLPVFREKGGGRYPENEMLERAVQEAGLRHLGAPGKQFGDCITPVYVWYYPHSGFFF